jgi:hypothetical protein
MGDWAFIRDGKLPGFCLNSMGRTWRRNENSMGDRTVDTRALNLNAFGRLV